MATAKVTNKQYFEALRVMVEGLDMVGEFPAEDVLKFIDGRVEQIDAKAAKAKVRAAEKKADGDELRAAVQAVLTDEFQTREQIFAQIDGADLTVAKIGARLTQLVGAGVAVKEQVKVEDRKVMAYKLAGEVEAVEDAE